MTRFRIFVAVVTVVAAAGVVVLQMFVNGGTGTAGLAGLPVGTVVYEHDFSAPENGLLAGAPSDAGSKPTGSRSSEYTPEGTMTVEVTSSIAEFVGGGNTENVVVDGRPLGGLPGVSIEVDATPLETGPSSAWGLACRRDRSIGRFYFASVGLVEGSARATIIRQDEPGIGWVDIASADVPAEVTIEQGSTNRLRLDCIGNTISLYVDGVPVVEGSDPRYARGSLAVFVQPIPAEGSESTARVEFDNFVVREVT